MAKSVVECEYCGAKARRWPAEIERVDHIFCSAECSAAFRSKKVEASCSNCGTEVLRKPSKFNQYEHHFCDNSCEGEWRTDHYEQGGNVETCDHCGDEFKRRPSHVRRGTRTNVYCSQECYYTDREYATGEDHPMWNGGYDYYQNESWLRIRRQVIERDGHECRACGAAPDRLDVHHIIPTERFGSFEEASTLNNLVALCRPCHQRYEGVPVVPA